MARSTYVYVVLREGDPLAGFTVKHELVTWLRQNSDLVTVDDVEVWRITDGAKWGVTAMTMNKEALVA